MRFVIFGRELKSKSIQMMMSHLPISLMSVCLHVYLDVRYHGSVVKVTALEADDR